MCAPAAAVNPNKTLAGATPLACGLRLPQHQELGPGSLLSEPRVRALGDKPPAAILVA